MRGAVAVAEVDTCEKSLRYLIDNSILQCNTEGIDFRLTKDISDIDKKSAPARWGEIVEGIDEGDGWLKVGHNYLPIAIQGHLVIIPWLESSTMPVHESPHRAAETGVEEVPEFFIVELMGGEVVRIPEGRGIKCIGDLTQQEEFQKPGSVLTLTMNGSLLENEHSLENLKNIPMQGLYWLSELEVLKKEIEDSRTSPEAQEAKVQAEASLADMIEELAKEHPRVELADEQRRKKSEEATARAHEFLKVGNETQAFDCFLESYRYWPTDVDVIVWLAVYNVKSERYEKAALFFACCAQIDQDEVKWLLMVASCYRRMGVYEKALKFYEAVHKLHPYDMECVRYLIAILKETNQPHGAYAAHLQKLERLQELQKGA